MIPIVTSADLEAQRIAFSRHHAQVDFVHASYPRAYYGELVYGIGATEARPTGAQAAMRARALMRRQSRIRDAISVTRGFPTRKCSAMACLNPARGDGLCTTHRHLRDRPRG